MQQARHEADYDIGEPFAPVDAAVDVAPARLAFVARAEVRDEPLAQRYLYSLLFRDRPYWLTGRPDNWRTLNSQNAFGARVSLPRAPVLTDQGTKARLIGVPPASEKVPPASEDKFVFSNAQTAPEVVAPAPQTPTRGSTSPIEKLKKPPEQMQETLKPPRSAHARQAVHPICAMGQGVTVRSKTAVLTAPLRSCTNIL